MARPGDFRGKDAKKNPQKYPNMGKSSIRAGKSKGSTAARKLQNAEVKDGTIKLGKNGKSYNVYDAKTGTWKRGVVKTVAPKPTSTGGVASESNPRIAERTPSKPSRPTGPKGVYTKPQATKPRAASGFNARITERDASKIRPTGPKGAKNR